MSHLSPIKQRLRITFGKTGALKYTSNLDIAKIWERVLRRANLPILYTQGFNTRPRIQLAMPLPLGITSECELLDVALREIITLDRDRLAEQILAVSPAGLQIHEIEEIPPNTPALQTQIHSAGYRIHFVDKLDMEELQQSIDAILTADSIMLTKERKRKKPVRYDMRPLVHRLYLDEHQDFITHLAVGEQGNLRPDVLLEYMRLSDTYHTIHRTHLYIKET